MVALVSAHIRLEIIIQRLSCQCLISRALDLPVQRSSPSFLFCPHCPSECLSRVFCLRGGNQAAAPAEDHSSVSCSHTAGRRRRQSCPLSAAAMLKNPGLAHGATCRTWCKRPHHLRACASSLSGPLASGAHWRIASTSSTCGKVQAIIFDWSYPLSLFCCCFSPHLCLPAQRPFMYPSDPPFYFSQSQWHLTGQAC